MTKQECIDLLIESGHREYEHNKYVKVALSMSIDKIVSCTQMEEKLR